MFSASSCFRLWNAMPQHSPAALKAGPPLLPLLMAASIWMPSSSAAPCTYDVTSMRDTTPAGGRGGEQVQGPRGGGVRHRQAEEVVGGGGASGKAPRAGAG
jgi:hypothetical protein